MAVFQGLADIEMCLPHNMQQIEEDRGRLMQKYELVRRELDRQAGEDLIVGDDPGIQEVLELIRQVGPTPTTVLIRGETGTGKELTATRHPPPEPAQRQAAGDGQLHDHHRFASGKRTVRPQERVLYRGNRRQKRGFSRRPTAARFFWTRSATSPPNCRRNCCVCWIWARCGRWAALDAKKVDVRLIAATNKNLEHGVREGWFREDLYYRLNVFTILLPPLRDRADSIPALAQHFLEKARKKLNKNIVGIEERAVKAMQHYPWPGNIREMQNIIERSFCPGTRMASSGWKTFPPSSPIPMNAAPMVTSTAAGHHSRLNGNCMSAGPKRTLSDAILKKREGTWPRRPVWPIFPAALSTDCSKNMASRLSR